MTHCVYGFKRFCFIQGETDPYAVPKSMGIFRLLESPKSITTSSVAQRIVANHEAYMVLLTLHKFFWGSHILLFYDLVDN